MDKVKKRIGIEDHLQDKLLCE
ncbi:phage head-tail adapter protein, partial [Staphylococcus pseudintermedius]